MDVMKANNLNIFYEDNHIIVVEKPYNIPSQEDSSHDPDMLSLVKAYIKEKYNKPGNVYVGLVHRLDRPVGGIMVFAKTSKAASRLSKEIQEHQFKKKYLAVVQGILKEKEGKLINYIKKDRFFNAVITNEKEGKYAELSYKVLEEKGHLSLLKINLKTGRHHQIRIQFQNQHHPLYGDQRYGEKNNQQIALYAYEVSFVHPVKQEFMVFKNLPHYGIFTQFDLLKKD